MHTQIGNIPLSPSWINDLAFSPQSYFLADRTEKVIPINGLRGSSVQSIDELMPHGRRILIGSFVYDGAAKKSKYEMAVFYDSESFMREFPNTKMDLLRTIERAKEAEREVMLRLTRTGIPAEINTEIIDLGDFGFYVGALVTPELRGDITEVDRKINHVVSEMGISPRMVH